MDGRTGTGRADRPPVGQGGTLAAGRVRPALAGGGQRSAKGVWPLSASLGPAAALATAPGMARAFTRTALAGWGLSRAGDLGEMSVVVVSELCTNVVQAATGADGLPAYQGPHGLSVLWVRLRSDRRVLRVEVWDDLPPSAGDPVLRGPGGSGEPADFGAGGFGEPGELAEHGRGLLMVRDLSRQWGWARAPDGRAKVVWSLLDPAPSAPRPSPI